MRISVSIILAALVLSACGQTPPPQTTAASNDGRADKQIIRPQPAPIPPRPESEPESEPAANVAIPAPSARHKPQAVQQDYAAHESQPSVTRGFVPSPVQPAERENYAHFDDASIKRVAEHPVSTFSIDVDTGAYSNVRRFLNQGRLPRRDAVRVEELVNYFDYNYAQPRAPSRPFSVSTETAVTPWKKNTRLLQIGIQGWQPSGEIPPSNLVFLIDVSGSMQSPDKLPLLQSAMKLLAKQLDKDDSLSIAVYAGAAGTVLEPTPGDQQAKIMRAIDNLRAGGSTNGGAGIRLAYSLAQQAFKQDGVNRVILASDGDFNVGTVNFQALIDLVAEKRESNIALTTLGFGTGNYNDHLVEQLSNKGNGNYAYIDNLAEAQRVLVDNRAATLQTIAKDVKIQLEFNPQVVSEYRLIGYENRALKREDFNNDQIDAGEIGAGHSVTALYEVALVGDGGERIDALRYGDSGQQQAHPDAEFAFLRLRYKAPDSDTSQLIERPILQTGDTPIADASDNLRFAAAVAGFGQLLRGGDYLPGVQRYNFPQILELARAARGQDNDGRRGEFLQLVQLADSLSTQANATTQPRTQD